jgi:hypothetical protein
MGDINSDGDGGGVDGDGSGDNSPSRQGAGTETFVPPKLVFNGGSMMACKNSLLGTPREEGMMSTAASLPSVVKPRLNRTSRRKPNFRR